jgi:hypothetical protein
VPPQATLDVNAVGDTPSGGHVLIGKPLVEPGNNVVHDVVDAPRRSGPTQQTCRVRFVSCRALSTR